MSYVIEYLSSDGWGPLTESTERTGFRRRQVEFATREDAEAAIGDRAKWRGVRVVERKTAPANRCLLEN